MSVVTLPDTIDRTGVDDVAAALDDWLASVPDGATVDLPAGATLRCEQTVVLRQRRDLTVRANGTTIVATTRGHKRRAHLRIEDSTGIVVDGLAIRGANPRAGTGEDAYDPEVEHQHGIDIRSSTDITVEGCTVTDTHGDLVYVGRHETGPASVDVHITRSVLQRSGRQGIAVVAARDVIVEGCILDQAARAMIDLEPIGPAESVEQVTVRRNIVGPSRLMWVAAGNADRPVHDVEAVDNWLFGAALQIHCYARSVGLRDRWTIAGNVSNAECGTPHGSVMRFWRVDGLTVWGNVQPLDPARHMALVATSHCADVSICGNDTPGGTET